jgi:hypothetical protein
MVLKISLSGIKRAKLVAEALEHSLILQTASGISQFCFKFTNSE